VTVVRADAATVRLPRRPFRVVANPPWAVAESVRAHLLQTPSLVRADLVLPRWLVHRWAARSPRIAVGSSLRAEAFSPPAPTGGAVAVLHGRRTG
jgi:23S rRNA (adenine-N6)-dimethyltransferase